jgi:hypothetical protein
LAIKLGGEFWKCGARAVMVSDQPGLVKKIEPEYPLGFVLHGAKGRDHFRLTINSKSRLVDEVKVVQSSVLIQPTPDSLLAGQTTITFCPFCRRPSSKETLRCRKIQKAAYNFRHHLGH